MISLPWRALLLAALWLLGCALPPGAAAEYGDVVLNQRSDANGVRPVVFPHWFHRIRFRCKVCQRSQGLTAMH